MNEKLDLVKILRNCPKGTPLYSTIHGNVTLLRVIESETCVYPIELVMEEYNSRVLSVTKYGLSVNAFPGECVLFPSKDQRDWSKFERFWNKPKRECFDPKILQPFDRVLARYNKACRWKALFFSHFYMTQDGEDVYVCDNAEYMYCIPFDDNTKHLVGTKNEAPEYYRYWED